jgi:hypothetical protein|uniref:Uncharacterized protein n=1 Tax=Myoviridae sp. ct8mY9 TaxID=2827664 RepID=A0A8S5SEZ6_9CAUD|nr:MAG TPA: hypothetical protein [Myoviridae sp. ct8mY9]
MNIEEDIKKVKELNNLLKFFKTHGWIPNLSRNTNINETIEAIEHVLAERKEDKKTIKELEEHQQKFYNGEIYTAKQLKQVEENQKKYFINKQKVKEIIDRLNISDIEPWSTYKVSGDILFDLKKLLEDK